MVTQELQESAVDSGIRFSNDKTKIIKQLQEATQADQAIIIEMLQQCNGDADEALMKLVECPFQVVEGRKGKRKPVGQKDTGRKPYEKNRQDMKARPRDGRNRQRDARPDRVDGRKGARDQREPAFVEGKRRTKFQSREQRQDAPGPSSAQSKPSQMPVEVAAVPSTQPAQFSQEIADVNIDANAQRKGQPPPIRPGQGSSMAELIKKKQQEALIQQKAALQQQDELQDKAYGAEEYVDDGVNGHYPEHEGGVNDANVHEDYDEATYYDTHGYYGNSEAEAAELEGVEDGQGGQGYIQSASGHGGQFETRQMMGGEDAGEQLDNQISSSMDGTGADGSHAWRGNEQAHQGEDPVVGGVSVDQQKTKGLNQVLKVFNSSVMPKQVQNQGVQELSSHMAQMSVNNAQQQPGLIDRQKQSGAYSVPPGYEVPDQAKVPSTVPATNEAGQQLLSMMEGKGAQAAGAGANDNAALQRFYMQQQVGADARQDTGGILAQLQQGARGIGGEVDNGGNAQHHEQQGLEAEMMQNSQGIVQKQGQMGSSAPKAGQLNANAAAFKPSTTGGLPGAPGQGTDAAGFAGGLGGPPGPGDELSNHLLTFGNFQGIFPSSKFGTNPSESLQAQLGVGAGVQNTQESSATGAMGPPPGYGSQGGSKQDIGDGEVYGQRDAVQGGYGQGVGGKVGGSVEMMLRGQEIKASGATDSSMFGQDKGGNSTQGQYYALQRGAGQGGVHQGLRQGQFGGLGSGMDGNNGAVLPKGGQAGSIDTGKAGGSHTEAANVSAELPPPPSAVETIGDGRSILGGASGAQAGGQVQQPGSHAPGTLPSSQSNIAPGANMNQGFAQQQAYPPAGNKVGTMGIGGFGTGPPSGGAQNDLQGMLGSQPVPLHNIQQLAQMQQMNPMAMGNYQYNPMAYQQLLLQWQSMQHLMQQQQVMPNMQTMQNMPPMQNMPQPVFQIGPYPSMTNPNPATSSIPYAGHTHGGVQAPGVSGTLLGGQQGKYDPQGVSQVPNNPPPGFRLSGNQYDENLAPVNDNKRDLGKETNMNKPYHVHNRQQHAQHIKTEQGASGGFGNYGNWGDNRLGGYGGSSYGSHMGGKGQSWRQNSRR